MAKVKVEDWSPQPAAVAMVANANRIIQQYARQGYDLTLRQLYYQFVSRDLIPNKMREYKRLGDVVSKARRAGMIDWNAIVDRTRMLRKQAAWESPESIVAAVAEQYQINLWDDQENYVEVWFEKDALMGVFERATDTHRIPFFSCRGYASDSEVWAAARRLAAHDKAGRVVTILHFGDHDPSGIDMTRDIGDRLELFGAKVDVRRLALNMDQVDQYKPPPNPAKETDSRFDGYRTRFGDESWELDALEPTVLSRLVSDEVADLIDWDAWDARAKQEEAEKAQLAAVSERFAEVQAFLQRSKS